MHLHINFKLLRQYLEELYCMWQQLRHMHKFDKLHKLHKCQFEHYWRNMHVCEW